MKSTFSIPAEFTDEDIWFKYFSKKSLLCLIGGLAVMIALGKITAVFGSMAAGLIVGGIFVLFLMGVTMIKLPETEYLKGAGQTIDVILIRRLIRHKNRCIYVRGYQK